MNAIGYVDLLDYLARDDATQRRHEYIAGEVYAMSGGRERHNRIAFNIARLLADRRRLTRGRRTAERSSGARGSAAPGRPHLRVRSVDERRHLLR